MNKLKTKLDGEIAIMSSMITNAVIIRTSWLYSEYGNNFVDTILSLAKERKKLNIVFDQIGSPTYAYDLATSITEGKTTDFEKAEAIMYYLRNNYYYNINGTLTPNGDDYVDYFLFGNPGQDGKCTNFASAFTVLARLNNIPTRYVEGNGGGSVVTPEEWEDSGYGSSTGYTIEEDTRVVTMLNGHAYAEVLLDGIGWLTFEPTSSNTCPTCDSNAAGTTGEDDTVEGNGTQPGTDYEINDSDGDGLSDEYEEGIGTDPFNMDTDGDTLPDGAETNTGEYIDVEDLNEIDAKDA